jgi:hypothetical protein
MKRIIFLALMLVAINAYAQNITVPEELKPFIMPGYEVLDVVKGDLNKDKLDDYLLVLKTTGEDSISIDNPDWDAHRPLLLILRQANGTLRMAAMNNELILCKHCGGIMGDPYQGLTVKPGEFTADFYGGSSWRWGEGFTFQYDAAKKNWFLQKHQSASFHSGDPENTTTSSVISRTEIGNVSIEKFTPQYNSEIGMWQVNAVKTFFYSSPNLRSKPGKAFLLKGDRLKSIKSFKNFVYASFTNKGGVTTSGYLLKKDLQKILFGKTASQ